jgi:hypothetical protein
VFGYSVASVRARTRTAVGEDVAAVAAAKIDTLVEAAIKCACASAASAAWHPGVLNGLSWSSAAAVGLLGQRVTAAQKRQAQNNNCGRPNLQSAAF